MHVMSQFIPKAGFPVWKASSPTAAPKTNDEVFELSVMPHCDALYRAAIALTMDAGRGAPSARGVAEGVPAVAADPASR